MKKRLFAVIILVLCTLYMHAKTYIATQDVNVRAGAGTTFELLGKIEEGATVEVTETKGTWGKIEYKGEEAYVSTQYLKEEASPAEAGKGKSNNTLIIIIAGIVVIGLCVFFFIKSKKATGEILVKNPSETTEPVEATYWYNCNKCDATKEALHTPDTANCPSNKKTGLHQWYKLAPAGPIHYQCEKCGVLITSTKLPDAPGCSRGPDPLHKWDKF